MVRLGIASVAFALICSACITGPELTIEDIEFLAVESDRIHYRVTVRNVGSRPLLSRCRPGSLKNTTVDTIAWMSNRPDPTQSPPGVGWVAGTDHVDPSGSTPELAPGDSSIDDSLGVPLNVDPARKPYLIVRLRSRKPDGTWLTNSACKTYGDTKAGTIPPLP